MANQTIKKIERAGRKLLMRLFGFFAPAKKMDSVPSDAKISKILILPQNRLGDVIVALGHIRALAQKFRHADIRLVTNERNDVLFSYEPENISRIRYSKLAHKFLRSLFEVRKFAPDVIIDLQMQESVTSALYAIFSGAKYRLRVAADVPTPFNIFAHPDPLAHIVDKYDNLFDKIIDKNFCDISRGVRYTDTERAFAIKFFSTVSIHKDRLIALNLSAFRENRKMSFEQNTELASFLTKHGFWVVLLTTSAEITMANRISMIVKNVLIAPNTPTILHLAAMLPYFSAVISPDTAIVHLCSAENIPVFGLYTGKPDIFSVWKPWGKYLCAMQSKTYDDLTGIDMNELCTAFMKFYAQVHPENEN